MHQILVPDRYRLADGQIDTAAIKSHVAIEDVVRMATRRMTGGGDSLAAICPFHEDHSPSLAVTPSSGLFYCHACRVGGDVIDFVMMVSHVPFVEACEWLVGANLTCTAAVREGTIDAGAKRMRNRELARSEWRAAVPIAGTTADLYLASRGISGSVPGSLRFGHVPRWYDHASNREGPRLAAMLAACQDVDGRITGLQRLYLDRQGRKRFARTPRLSLGQIRGGALRLGPEAHSIMLTEGIEDGLSLMRMHVGTTVWVALGAGNLPHVRLPPIVRHVVVAADADEPGIAAAEAARDAYRLRSLQVDVISPDHGAKDFNEQWMLLHA
jgi:DNA primase